MELFEIQNKEEWNGFISSLTHSEFLQSWEWGEFQTQCGNQVYRLALKRENRVLATTLAITRKIPGLMGKKYLYCPRGPVLSRGSGNREEISRVYLEKLMEFARENDAIFTRIEPADSSSLKGFGARRTIDIQPRRTIRLDLGKSEEELMTAMHQKTRYNIRLAKKRGVAIVEGGDSDFDEFWSLMSTTGDRDGFRLHSREHYRKMLEYNQGHIRLLLAKYQDQTIAANIISLFGDTAVYMHGASANRYRNVMAPYLLQWHAIRLAKREGLGFYDFYGIDEEKWPGVTRFKRGFGGNEFEYPGTYDVIADKLWYSIYNSIRKIRRKIKL